MYVYIHTNIYTYETYIRHFQLTVQPADLHQWLRPVLPFRSRRRLGPSWERGKSPSEPCYLEFTDEQQRFQDYRHFLSCNVVSLSIFYLEFIDFRLPISIGSLSTITSSRIPLRILAYSRRPSDFVLSRDSVSVPTTMLSRNHLRIMAFSRWLSDCFYQVVSDSYLLAYYLEFIDKQQHFQVG